MTKPSDIEITEAMIDAALDAQEPYVWEDGVIGCPGRREAMGASLRAAIQVRREAAPR